MQNYDEIIEEINLYLKDKLLQVKIYYEYVDDFKIEFVAETAFGREIVRKKNWNSFLLTLSKSFPWRNEDLDVKKWIVRA